MSFDGKTAIVTGSGSGIGHATAALLAARGARVAHCDLSTAGLNGATYVVDVSDPAAVEAVCRQIKDDLGPPDILVNSAGIREICHPLSLDPAEWARVLEVNLSGSFFMAQAVARLMRESGIGGSIVNVASTAGLIASHDRAAYVASKHGVVGLTKQLAWDLGRDRIRVNAVAPAVTRTALTASYFAEPQREAEIIANYPLGRVGEAADVAKAICFLSSDDAAFISGVILPVDGGTSAGKR